MICIGLFHFGKSETAPFCRKLLTGKVITMMHFLFQVMSLFVMGTLAITDSISMSFFSNYMLKDFAMTEKNSGWILMVASLFYSLFTFVSGLIGSRKEVTHLLSFYFLSCIVNLLYIFVMLSLFMWCYL